MVLNLAGFENHTSFFLTVSNLENTQEIYRVPPRANVSQDMWLAQVADGSKGVSVEIMYPGSQIQDLLLMWDYDWKLNYVRAGKKDLIEVNGNKDFKIKLYDNRLEFSCINGTFDGFNATKTWCSWRSSLDYVGEPIDLLDVWGEGRIVTTEGDISGFKQAFNINKWDKTISNGPNKGEIIPKLLPICDYEDPVFPLEDNVASYITIIGSPCTVGTAKEMYRVLHKVNGVVILYDVDESYVRNFEANMGNLVLKPNDPLNYPFNEITFPNVRIYGFPKAHDHDEL